MRVEFNVNGSSRSFETDPQRSLLEVLREDLHLTGTKYGCGEGACRACTVLIDGVATVSCLTPVLEAQGKAVRTIEGLESAGALHPVQQAFLAAGAMQCGYCIPGMVLTTVGLLAKTPHPSDDEIVAALNGNLCRCCSYPSILEAVRIAAGRSSGEK